MINNNTYYGNMQCDKSVRASVSIFNCAVVEGNRPVVMQNSQVLRMTLTELWEAQVPLGFISWMNPFEGNTLFQEINETADGWRENWIQTDVWILLLEGELGKRGKTMSLASPGPAFAEDMAEFHWGDTIVHSGIPSIPISQRFFPAPQHWPLQSAFSIPTINQLANPEGI